MIRRLRIISQIVFFVLFSLSFLLIANQAHAYRWPVQWFIRLNPLNSLLTFLASHTIETALLASGIVVAVVSVLFGRVFCGFLCPLGSAIDFIDKYIFTKMRSRSRRPPPYLQRAKYLTLFAFITLAAGGAIFPLFFDPLSIMTRLYTLFVNPLILFTTGTIVTISAPLLKLVGLEAITYVSLKPPVYYGYTLGLLLIIIVFCGSFWDKRFWCQYVCPSGALFGLLGRFSLWRRYRVESKCSSCTICARHCPTHAIDERHVEKTNQAECIVCGFCTQIKDNCSSFKLSLVTPMSIHGPDLHRRHLLTGIAGGLVLLPSFKFSAVKKRDDTGRLIRPPGSVPEDEFLAKCIACGECMKVCPTNTIQPCSPADGFARVNTPKIVPRIAGCEEKCHVCGYVCPTGAIRKISVEDKQFAKIGTAVIDRDKCVAWEQNKMCLVCDEVCPYNAIEGRLIQTTKGLFKVPIIYEDLCTGCGMCEQHCPVFDSAAIVVYKFGENRRNNGPYASEEQKISIIKRRNRSDSQVLFGDDSTKSTLQKNPDIKKDIPDSSYPESGTNGSGSSLPPGFL